MLHTDQGVTYKNKRYMQYVAEHGMELSMSKKGCPYDNCVIENFWGTLKVEKIYRLKHMPSNMHELEQIVKEYLYFYINIRKNSALGYLTPAEYYAKNNLTE